MKTYYIVDITDDQGGYFIEYKEDEMEAIKAYRGYLLHLTRDELKHIPDGYAMVYTVETDINLFSEEESEGYVPYDHIKDIIRKYHPGDEI